MALSRLAAFVRARDELALRCFLAFAQVAALFWFAVPVGFPLDDAWIHQVVARTFVESGTLGYAPGQHGAAATSYLWAALLANGLKLHIDPVRWAFALSLACSVVTGQLLYAVLVRRDDTSRLAKLGATLLACTSGNVLWFAHSGMEASLLVALSITAVWAATAPAASLGSALTAGIASGLVALTRPEGALLCLLLVGYALSRRWGARRLVALVAPQVGAVLAYVGTNLASTGHVMPATLAGRRWLWFEITSGLSGADRTVELVQFWVNRLSTYTFDTGRIVAWCFIGVAAYGAVRLLRESNEGARLLFAWAAIHTGSYVLLLPTPGHGGRYQPFIPILYCTCIALGASFVVGDLARLAFRSRPKLPEWVGPAAALPLLALALVTTAELRRAHALAVAHIDATELATGRFVSTLPLDGRVASFDIGGIGWTTRRPILDAGGLSDAATATLLEKGRIWEHLAKLNVHYVVLPDGYERELPIVDRYITRLHLHDNPAVLLTRLHDVESPFELWKPGVDATWNAAPRQVVYRIEYTGLAGPPEIALPPPGIGRPVRDDGARVPRTDRLLAERSLAVLEAWGVPVDVQVSLPGPSPNTSPICAVQLGPSDVAIAGCDPIADADLLRGALHLYTARYLAVADLGGALRAIPHAIAIARRRRDPRFHPPLAPLMLPEAPTHAPSMAWSIPIVLAIAGLAAALERRTRPKDVFAKKNQGRV